MEPNFMQTRHHSNFLFISLAIGAITLTLSWPPFSAFGQAANTNRPCASTALEVPLTIKECAEVGANAYPISVVMPLPKGQYTSAASLGIAGVP
jgi:hypothetical protein